jgi:hypothetical protein
MTNEELVFMGGGWAAGQLLAARIETVLVSLKTPCEKTSRNAAALSLL